MIYDINNCVTLPIVKKSVNYNDLQFNIVLKK